MQNEEFVTNTLLMPRLVAPNGKPSKLNWIQWQTWEFDKEKPIIGWSKGICESDDFFITIKPALEQVGQILFWRNISTMEM